MATARQNLHGVLLGVLMDGERVGRIERGGTDARGDPRPDDVHAHDPGAFRYRTWNPRRVRSGRVSGERRIGAEAEREALRARAVGVRAQYEKRGGDAFTSKSNSSADGSSARSACTTWSWAGRR